MLSKKLPPAGHKFKMSGTGSFSRKFSSMIRYGEFSNLKNNKDLALKIFKRLSGTIRRYGRIPLSSRTSALREFSKDPKTTKEDVRDFKKILDHYK